ncbi:MAG: hypothetical protein OXU69_08670 [Gemmatimonadota bacterium]|nr:hypothetical protein [bacterium]MDE2984766.1 hypothetical protein [Gemmatimonadota bacterium]
MTSIKRLAKGTCVVAAFLIVSIGAVVPEPGVSPPVVCEMTLHDNYKIERRWWFDPKGHTRHHDGERPRAPWVYEDSMWGDKKPAHQMFWENGWAIVHHNKCDPRGR